MQKRFIQKIQKTANEEESFNREHGRHGSGEKKGLRFNDAAVGRWKQGKQDTYRSGRQQREFLKEKS